MRVQLGGWAASFMLLMVFLAIVFLTGGGARDDIVSLALLRPLSVLFLGMALILLTRETWRDHRALILLACAMPILILIQLLPLPPALWTALPGRELSVEIGTLTGADQPWRPLALVPYRGWNAFWACAAPLAALLLALGLPREHSRKLVYVLAALILISGLIGLLQSMSGSGSKFYLYRVTNEDSAVGLFANRNHQAMLLAMAFPVIAAAVSLSKGAREAVRPKLWLAIGMGVMTLPFLLVTGSRAGLVLGAVGIAMAFFVYRDPTANLQVRRQPPKFNYRLFGIGAVAAALVLTTALVARSSALQRLFVADASEDLRLRVWGPILDSAWTYFPFGSGIGSFVEVYKVVEPDANLSPQYLNHAHNDWLEALLTGGLPLIAILLVAGVVFGRAVWRAAAQRATDPTGEGVTARLGAAIVIILALGSIYDYPLRVPSLACLFAIGAAWLVRGTARN